MCHSTQFNYARIEGDSFDFDPSFEFISPYIQSADLALGNLETTLAGNAVPYSGYPQFNTPDAYAFAVKNAGFDCIITANNHSNDTGEKGILRTIRVLDSLGLSHTGSFTAPKDRDSIRILDVKGVKVGIVAYTYSTNGLPLTDGKPWLVNPCDTVLIGQDIAKGRAAGAELMIIFYHFGDEYQRTPNAYQKSFVQYAIDQGADIVFGSHPHVLQPVAFYKGERSRVDSVFVAWSMGNFISNQQDEYTDEGVVVQLHCSKHLRTGRISIDSVTTIPTWVYKGKSAERKIHTIIPVTDSSFSAAPEWMRNAYKGELEKAYLHTNEILKRPVLLSD